MIDLNQYPHDSNLTLNCLLLTLTNVATNGTLPNRLYVQLDNCARENKNQFFLGCMGVLVARDIVEEVWLSFLMVGHTHEGERVNRHLKRVTDLIKKIYLLHINYG